jgi:hypothetical protein
LNISFLTLPKPNGPKAAQLTQGGDLFLWFLRYAKFFLKGRNNLAGILKSNVVHSIFRVFNQSTFQPGSRVEFLG